jgi:hypothetical protein
MHGQRSTSGDAIAPDRHASTAGLSIAGANTPQPDDTDLNPN